MQVSVLKQILKGNDTIIQTAAEPLVLVRVQKVLDQLNTDDVHFGLKQTLVEKGLDTPVGPRALRDFHQAVVLP